MTSKNKPKTETEPLLEAKPPKYVKTIPKIKVVRKNNSKYELEFAAIPEGQHLEVVGKKQISRYFSALKRLQKQGKFQNFECHTRTTENGEVHGYIGEKHQ